MKLYRQHAELTIYSTIQILTVRRLTILSLTILTFLQVIYSNRDINFYDFFAACSFSCMTKTVNTMLPILLKLVLTGLQYYMEINL